MKKLFTYPEPEETLEWYRDGTTGEGGLGFSSAVCVVGKAVAGNFTSHLIIIILLYMFITCHDFYLFISIR